jgi:hypothetical protein
MSLTHHSEQRAHLSRNMVKKNLRYIHIIEGTFSLLFELPLSLCPAKHKVQSFMSEYVVNGKS